MKKGDFIEVEYTGTLRDGQVFDTTDEKAAKDAHIYNEKSTYGPIVVCLGEGHLLKGLDAALEGKDAGKHHVELAAEDAFGKRQGKLLQLIPTQKLKKSGIDPYPGLQLNMDNMIATVKTVSGGRTILDFNHPLAGKDVVYDIDVKKSITDEKEKVKALLNVEFNLTSEVKEKEGTYEVDVPEPLQKSVKERVKKVLDKDVVFMASKKQ